MTKACLRCKQKKLRCDGLQPACAACVESGSLCESCLDMRVDKRSVQNGVTSFVFKNTGERKRRKKVFGRLDHALECRSLCLGEVPEDVLTGLENVPIAPLLGLDDAFGAPFDMEVEDFCCIWIAHGDLSFLGQIVLPMNLVLKKMGRRLTRH